MPSVSERHTTMDSIDNARAQGCLNRVGNKPAAGTSIQAADINNLVTWLTQAKTAQGYPHAIQGNVGAGGVMTDVLANMRSQASAIQNHCVCHCQCSGSCKGSCTGTCAGSCTGNCTGTCSGGCQGTCNNTCSGGCSGGCSNTCNTTCKNYDDGRGDKSR